MGLAALGTLGDATFRTIAGVASSSSTPAVGGRSEAGVLKFLASAPKKMVVDTNVLARLPKEFLSAMGQREIIVPDVVLNELKGLEARRAMAGAEGASIRGQFRNLLALFEEAREAGTITETPTGFSFRVNAEGGTIRTVVVSGDYHQVSLEKVAPFYRKVGRSGAADQRILGVALQESAPLLTHDGPLALWAPNNGIQHVRLEDITEMITSGSIQKVEDSDILDVRGESVDLPDGFLAKHDLVPNTPVEVNGFLGRIGAEGKVLRWLPREDKWQKLSTHTFRPRNGEQAQLLAALKSPDIDMVSVAGPPGSGKTLLALAHGMDQLMTGDVKRVIIARPTAAVGGQELGFLPGGLDDKLAPLRQAVEDAIETLPGDYSPRAERWLQDGQIELAHVEAMRGRSLKGTVVIIDEAQNFDAETLLTLISRVDDGADDAPAKLILAHDVFQRDTGARAGSGLEYVLEGFRGENYFFEIALPESQRGRRAARAGELYERLKSGN